MRALFSACGLYRHLLDEPGRHQCAWIMLNPSIAGGVEDTGEVRSDPTANKVRQFSRDWGYDGFVIANVYDKVSTDPKGLWTGAPPVSPANDAYLLAAATLPLVVFACGKNAEPARLAYVAQLLRAAGAELWCLGANLDGSPKHPLYLPYTTKLRAWPLDGSVSVSA